MLPQYNTKIFTDVYPDYASFKSCFDNEFGSYAKDCISNSSLQALYWLLYSRYGANPIANYTVSLFKSKIVAITFAKGPTWEKRLDLQKKLRNLTDDELLTGSKTILNKALHDERQPGTDTSEELPYMNAQDVSKIKRSKIDAYSYLMDVLKTDVTEDFVQSFAKLFSKFVSPNVERIYENDIIIDDNEEDEENV